VHSKSGSFAMPELLHEVPSDEELRAYWNEHLDTSVFNITRVPEEELSRTYSSADSLLDAIVSLRRLGTGQFCQLAADSMFQSLRRLNLLAKPDPLWNNTNNRPTIYKLPAFCNRILDADPDDRLARWTLGSMAVWSYANHFGQDHWKPLYALGEFDIAYAVHAALLIQITATDTAEQLAELLRQSDAVVPASSTLERFRALGAGLIPAWVERVFQAARA
jgi:hypothetical protein